MAEDRLPVRVVKGNPKIDLVYLLDGARRRVPRVNDADRHEEEVTLGRRYGHGVEHVSSRHLDRVVKVYAAHWGCARAGRSGVGAIACNLAVVFVPDAAID